MPDPLGEPKQTEDRAELPHSEEQEEGKDQPVPQEEEPAANEFTADAESAAQSPDWWSTTPTSPEPADTVTASLDTDSGRPKESASADVYFCGHTTLFSLNRALQAIANEKLSGALRSFWDQEPIEVLTQNGEIVFATTRDPALYCPETPAVLANVDTRIVADARAQQIETGTPFFLTLARQESIAREAAVELVQHYGQRVFSRLWTEPRVWVMFEKNAELLNHATDVPAEANADDWALETLRFVENLGDQIRFNPTSIPAYTKEGFERVQKIKLKADEAQFASQFNGVRSVQQIAKNLRLDFKSACLMLFRFVGLEIAECWPASTTAKPERKSALQRFRQLTGRGR